MGDVCVGGRGGGRDRGRRVDRHETPRAPASLAPQHVAGAALIGLFGWEMLVNVPGSVVGYFTLTAGLGDVRGIEAQQAFVVAQAAYAIGAAFAVGGILRRRTWGAVLGIGLASATVVSSALSFAQFTAMFESMGGDAYLSILSSIGMRLIPALAAIVLLLWPFVRRGRDAWTLPARMCRWRPPMTPPTTTRWLASQVG